MTRDESCKILYELELFQQHYYSGSIYTRVPGGWVYHNDFGCTFIPFSREFAKPIKMDVYKYSAKEVEIAVKHVRDKQLSVANSLVKFPDDLKLQEMFDSFEKAIEILRTYVK